MRHYATTASPLRDLLEDKTFTWPPTAVAAFTSLKKAMTTLPILALPDFSSPFEVTIDTSTMAIGVVLSQQDHPIAFFSKKCVLGCVLPHIHQGTLCYNRGS